MKSNRRYPKPYNPVKVIIDGYDARNGIDAVAEMKQQIAVIKALNDSMRIDKLLDALQMRMHTFEEHYERLREQEFLPFEECEGK